MRHLTSSVLAAVTVLLLSQNPAAAAPPDEDLSTPTMVWSVSSATTVPARPVLPDAARRGVTRTPRPLTGEETGSERAAIEEDLKTECRQSHAAQAGTASGWAKDRFQQCFLGNRRIDLIPVQGGSPVATIIIDYSVLAFSYDGERRVDYVFDFDDFNTLGGVPLPQTTLTVTFDGCNGSGDCSGTPASRTELVPAWKSAANRRVLPTIRSADDTGAGTYSIVRSLVQLSMSVVTPDPRILPWQESGMINSRVRFDSARQALGNGKFHGTVFTDAVPVLTLDKSPTSAYRAEANHVDQALHRPVLTFPNFVGKNVPGETRPLHRLMDSNLRNANHNASVGICKSVWGPDYANGGLQCDEYPFQSTYEGSYTSTGGSASRWHGSARPIDGLQNTNGGTALSNFYGINRVLDENMGTGSAGTPSDPFLVRVTGS